MTRNLLTAGLFLAGLSVAQAQLVRPGVTGQTGVNVYPPWNSGTVVGAPGTGTYNSNTGVYNNPYSWQQPTTPPAYNFNTGTYNSNSYPYNSGGVYNSGYYSSPYSNGNVIQSSSYYTPGSTTYYPSSGTYTSSSSYYTPSGDTYYSGTSAYYPNSVYYGSQWSTPVYSSGRGRWRGR